jgi:DnaJ-class molecular chaperone
VTGAEVILIVGAGAVTVWWVDVRLRPIRRCPSCNGSKRSRGSSEQRWGTCRRCKGTGEVRRFGARKE